MKQQHERGYFTIAQGEQYLKMAYALALSIKITQPEGYNNISIGVDPKERHLIPTEYLTVFDEIVDIPWGDDAVDTAWKLENEWKVYWMTPYQQTIKLDADMIFTHDVSSWWTRCEPHDMIFVGDVIAVNGETITSNVCREVFTHNHLPNVYSAFWYFKKSILSSRYFELMREASWNWQLFFSSTLDELNRPTYFSTDVVCGILAKALNIPIFNEVTPKHPTFVHLKKELHEWMMEPNSWQDVLGVYIDDGFNVVIGNYKQHVPIHYHEKTFMTDKIIQQLKSFAEKRNV